MLLKDFTLRRFACRPVLSVLCHAQQQKITKNGKNFGWKSQRANANWKSMDCFFLVFISGFASARSRQWLFQVNQQGDNYGLSVSARKSGNKNEMKKKLWLCAHGVCHFIALSLKTHYHDCWQHLPFYLSANSVFACVITAYRFHCVFIRLPVSYSWAQGTHSSETDTESAELKLDKRGLRTKLKQWHKCRGCHFDTI